MGDLVSVNKTLWRPYAQMKTALPPLLVAATQGSRIILQDGRELIDGVAAWWTACHGYNHPHIVAAMQDQLTRLPHIMFGGLNHQPAIDLARRLAALTPGDLNHVFFSDSGSVAVEVALKMAVQYRLNKGEQGRVKFVGFRHGYHGDTAACMALCDPGEGMHAHFNGYLPQQFSAALPEDAATAAAFDGLLARHRTELAGVIVEPLAQGVGGMRLHGPEVLQCIAAACRRHDVLLIADEVFTGFGRTGTLFACEQAAVAPDILCLGKALSAGMVTLAATVARGHVFDAFWSDNPDHALMHGPTYMANALACAAANASLDLFAREPRLQQAQAMEAVLLNGLAACRALPGVVDVRALGAIGVVQFDRLLDHKRVRQHLIEQGVWVRSWNDHIYLTPALNIDAGDLAALTQAVCATAAAITDDRLTA